MGDLNEALQFYEKYNQLEQELYDAYPSNVEFKNGLAISCIKLGLHYEQSDNQVTAKKYYEQSIDLLQALVRESPRYVAFQKNLDWVTARLAQLE